MKETLVTMAPGDRQIEGRWSESGCAGTGDRDHDKKKRLTTIVMATVIYGLIPGRSRVMGVGTRAAVRKRQPKAR